MRWSGLQSSPPSRKYTLIEMIIPSVTATNQEGYLCHISSPFPAGNSPDKLIFGFILKQKLEPGERVNTNDGYVGDGPSHIVATCGIRYMEDPQVYHPLMNNRG